MFSFLYIFGVLGTKHLDLPCFNLLDMIKINSDENKTVLSTYRVHFPIITESINVRSELATERFLMFLKICPIRFLFAFGPFYSKWNK